MTVALHQRKHHALSIQRQHVAMAFCMSLLASTPMLGQQASNRSLVSSSQILAVMQRQSLPVDGVEVHIAAPVTTAIADAQIDLQSGSILSTHEMRLRMSCHIHTQCLSFFVTAKWPEAVDVSALPVKMERRLFNNPTVHAGVASNQPGPVIAAEKSTTSTVKPGHDSAHPQSALRKGSPATLEIEESKIHILLDVICLQDGFIGDKVRVTSRDRKQVYMAEIIAPALLKGTL